MRSMTSTETPATRELSVLNLVPAPDSNFYRAQVDSLADLGVAGETLSVPGTTEGTGSGEGRSPVDYLRFFPRVRRAVSSDYHLVHANFGLTAPHALAQRELPVVLSLWGTDVFGPYGWVGKVCAPLCDAVVVMSEQMGEELPCDYTVIPHGVDFDRFEPVPKTEARAALGWSDRVHQVLFPAPTDRPEKDFPRAERIVDRTREELDDPVRLQTPDGDVPHRQMPTVLNASDALLLTSRHEGSPNVVKEALACNLPVVSTDVGDVADRIDGVTPSAVGSTDEELVDALVSILRRGERSNGRESIRNLSTRRTAERYRAVYERVLEEGGDSPSAERRRPVQEFHYNR